MLAKWNQLRVQHSLTIVLFARVLGASASSFDLDASGGEAMPDWAVDDARVGAASAAPGASARRCSKTTSARSGASGGKTRHYMDYFRVAVDNDCLPLFKRDGGGGSEEGQWGWITHKLRQAIHSFAAMLRQQPQKEEEEHHREFVFIYFDHMTEFSSNLMLLLNEYYFSFSSSFFNQRVRMWKRVARKKTQALRSLCHHYQRQCLFSPWLLQQKAIS